MAVTERTASVTLEGDRRVGTGSVQGPTASFDQIPSSLSERLEPENGKTTPEELLASAYAADYAMTLSTALSTQGSQPDRLEVIATCHLDRTPDGLAITRMRVEVSGRVPRLEAASFVEMAQKAEAKSLVSNAIRGNVEIELTAELLPSE